MKTDGLTMEFDRPDHAVIEVGQAIVEFGHEVAPRGMNTREITNFNLMIYEPWMLPFDIRNRDLNHDITRLEILSLLGQTPADAQQRRRVTKLASFQDDNVQWGNYGTRIRNQMGNVVRNLADDRMSRQAVLTIYDADRDDGYTKDKPCTLSIQFIVRNGRLTTTTTMRSNDVFLGLPYDLHQFCALHWTMASILNVEVGPYHHNVGSMHAYETHWERIDELDHYERPDELPTKPFNAMRMVEVTEFCQRALLGADMRPETDFETFLLDWRI